MVLGEPTYDNQQNVVSRDFGMQNVFYIIGIIIIGFVYHQSKKEYENKNYSIACKYHMLTHFLANFFNILLYMNIYK